jgi:hypothetical protein
VGARLVNNPAANNTTGRVKPTTLSDIQCGGLLTNEAWIKTGDGGDTQGYLGLFSNPALDPDAGGDLSGDVLVIQGIFDAAGTQLMLLKPAFQFPWLSQPTRIPLPPPPEGPSIQQVPEGRAPFAVEVTDVNENQILVPFDARQHDDGGGPGRTTFGAFSVMVALAAPGDSVRIMDIAGQTEFGRLVRSPTPPSIRLLSPMPGSILGAMTLIRWAVRDPDSDMDELMFQVTYSPDNGRSFVPLAVDLMQNEVLVDARQVEPSQGTGLIRVFVSDGLNTSFADVTRLSTNRPPDCTRARAS